jgi:hypothetical protein
MEAPHGSAAWKRRMEAPHGSAAWKRRMEAPHGSVAWKRCMEALSFPIIIYTHATTVIGDPFHFIRSAGG